MSRMRLGMMLLACTLVPVALASDTSRGSTGATGSENTGGTPAASNNRGSQTGKIQQIIEKVWTNNTYAGLDLTAVAAAVTGTGLVGHWLYENYETLHRKEKLNTREKAQLTAGAILTCVAAAYGLDREFELLYFGESASGSGNGSGSGSGGTSTEGGSTSTNGNNNTNNNNTN